MCERAPPAKGKRSLPAGYQRPVLFLLIRGAAAQVFDQRRAALGVIALVQGFGEVEGMRRLLAARRVEQAIEAAHRSDVVIFSIRYFDRQFYMQYGQGFGGSGTLSRISRDTGGSLFEVTKRKTLSSIYEAIND